MQLNDTGNDACDTNQVGDSETISTADVSQGTTDVDSPTASATGGAINYRTRVPDREFGAQANASVGSFNYRRIYGELQSGEVGPFGTRAFAGASYTKYDKFNGPGELEKIQYNARIYQPLGDNGDFASLAFHWNENRNAFYRQLTLAQFEQFGYDFEQDQSCRRPTPVGGTAQNDTTQSTFVTSQGVTGTGSCTNYFNTRVNPSDTGNIRGQFKYTLMDGLIFTVDPNFQYVLANGGGFTVVSETDNRLRGAAGPTAPGRDLNGDGDALDSVQLYTPNTTNTRRYGLNTSLIWDMNATNRFRIAYAYDRGRHRQTGEFTTVDLDGNTASYFGGKDGHGPKIATNDGSYLRGRDRFSVAELNMVAGEYIGRFFEERVELRAGIRAPFFKRELNQFCFSQNGSSSVLCTTQPVTATLANGNVNVAGQGTTQYIRPYSATVKYDKVLPNVGLSYKFDGGHSIYGSYAESLSAPRTDQLYTVIRLADGSIGNPDVQPEIANTVDIGYRYTQPNLLISIAAYNTKFKNRIATSFDPDLGINVDRNIGDVDIAGVDAQVVWQVSDYLSYIGNLSYNTNEVQDNIGLAGGLALLTKGKHLAETPEWQGFQRVELDIGESISVGIQGKWVGERFTTDVNDQKVRSYQLFDADIRWQLPVMGGDRLYVQANVKNIFDERYIGSISSTTNAVTVPGSNGLAPFLTRGSTRTFQVSLHAEF